MRQTQGLWQPDAALGVAVYGSAAVIFPLHLGWIGVPWAGFAAYLALATALFFAADATTRPRINRLPGVSQALLILLAIGTPATLAFAAGAFVGPIDEALDETVCLSSGSAEEDTPEAESDDTFDLSPDCRIRR